MHRIDPAIIKRDFEAAGLKFESESPAFANSADDHTKEVFDKAIRHKTDQFMYKFRKTSEAAGRASARQLVRPTLLPRA